MNKKEEKGKIRPNQSRIWSIFMHFFKLKERELEKMVLFSRRDTKKVREWNKEEKEKFLKQEY